jgi:hypothetical protein
MRDRLVGCRVDRKTQRQIEELAERQSRTVSHLLRLLIRNEIARCGQDDPAPARKTETPIHQEAAAPET